MHINSVRPRPPWPSERLGASLAIIASTLPMLRRITGPETARND